MIGLVADRVDKFGHRVEVHDAVDCFGVELVIIDPPRAGLHADVVEKLLQTKPEKIIYLSCNPVTQARDIALLTQSYTLTETRGYNFFPRTPHIETACLLTLSQ